MSKNTSPQTKSFIIIFAITIVGTYLCLIVSSRIENPKYSKVLNLGYDSFAFMPQSKTPNQDVASSTVDTSKWKTYVDERYNFSFKYNPAWKIIPGKIKNLYYTLEIDPGAKYPNFKIYVSSKSYYVMDGLPIKEQVLPNGLTALNVSNFLYGMKNNGYFYTFDIGYSLNLEPEFTTMVKSVTFTQ